ncbi:type VI secretion system Vgr family protein [Pandoraea communis]|uniref:type VI secretion system Vgr family protein n=1 Tax=Pandoraea communis TaxID=2508297 RepID=UPI0025A5C645|nr:type VI secretion system Vgr family protein [Pandoraea communis]MDM8359313.1 type VI secretion system Vgr family protein [Pandoraea communis]
MSTIVPSQAYELKLAPHPAPFSVLKFSGSDRVSQLYRYEIEFTSPKAGLPMEDVLGRPARFTIEPIVPGSPWVSLAQTTTSDPSRSYTVHGIITQFDEFETSADQTRYRVVLEPKLADLNRAATSRLFQKQTLEEIITSILRHEGYAAGVDFIFKLRDLNYKRREYVTQYRETTIAFIQRLCAQEGVWFRFEQQKDRAAVVFGDDMQAYARKQRVLPYRHDAGLESSGAEAVATLEKRTRRVPEAVRLHEYNHRAAETPLLVEQSAVRDDATTNAVDYHWGEHYETPEEGERIARIRHEAHLARQLTLSGTGNPFWLEAGEVLGLDPAPSDAPHGIFVTTVESRGSRSEAFWIQFEGIPSGRQWRTHLDAITRPTIDGILPARVTSPNNYQYAYLDEHGRYVVKLPFDLDQWSPGGTSRPVRMAKPYSGGKYGHHFPLIDGAEVALIFTNGDPDRPVIVGAMHNSEQPDLVISENKTRNLIVTAAGNVQRMEDLRGSEHVHLSTPYQASELNLGHMVDGEAKARGTGAELRTDGHAAARGAKGLLLSAEAQPGGTGEHLAMPSADQTLRQAQQILGSLNTVASAAKALLADVDTQRTLIEQHLNKLQRPAIVATSPEGIGIASGQDMQIAAQRQMFVTAGEGLDVGVMKRITVAAGETLSFLAGKLGIRLFAASGNVQIEAQADGMELLSMRDMSISSADGQITMTGKQGVTIGDGSGAYIKLSGGKVVLGSPAGEIELKGDLVMSPPEGANFAFPQWADAPVEEIRAAMRPGFSG